MNKEIFNCNNNKFNDKYGIQLNDAIISEISSLLTMTEIGYMFRLMPFIDEYNMLRYENKYLSMKEISDLIGDAYESVRRVIPALIKLHILCIYYVEVSTDKLIKAYMMNPNIMKRNNYKNKYFKAFFDNELLELNHALYMSNGRDTPEYRKWITDSLMRDKYTCQCCGKNENLEVHHILNYAQYKDLRTDLDNSITLCELCHSPIISGSFHHTYGTRNNTKKQLEEYLHLKRSGL